MKLSLTRSIKARFAIYAGAVFVLAGCATAGTLIEKRNLDVQTKMSETVFLDPTSPSKQTIFIQIRNTSDKPDLTIKDEVSAMIATRGWRVMDDPDKANYMLQANILQAGKIEKTAAEQAMRNGYGGAIGTAILAGGIAAGTGHNYGAAGAVGLAAGAADFVGGLLVKDVYMSVITDIQISQRAKSSGAVKVRGRQELAQGNSGGESQSYEESSDWKRYRTRVLSSANQANLEWADAQPAIVKGLTQSLGGLF